ncbi:hypothetical protein LSH36_281g09079 [Paralvinella palmiformis]|uniref:Protein aurora borealis n=1 Tax=Paralvinella palmiformis TaxID=53620 RepID=A0AAD9N4F8_9ANNE|nr:hypothetical protein LSH36_281g09079 [Paralvinella palmiformis]
MCERGVFNVGQPPSPIASVGMPTYISTPTNGTPDLNTDSEPHRSSQTPMKCMGHLYYNQQYKTPSINSPGWIGLAQSSPCVQTPGNSSSGSRIQAFGHLRTPSSNHSSKKGTPYQHTPNQPYNPFDSNLLEKLDGSLFSPNVFAEVQSVQQTPKSFQWTIDELAILKPADIEEFPNQPDAIPTQTDLDLEKRAQEVIDAYFANNLIAQSPWSNGSSKKNFVLPETPKTPASVNGTDSPLIFGDRKTPAVVKQTKSSVCDVACQTALTLPVEFNIEKVLGEYFTYKKEGNAEELGAQEILSMSTLRRKLFFHGEDCSPPSPVKYSECKAGRSMDYDPSPVISPLRVVHQTPKQSNYTPMETPTPSSAHFSSSPISFSHGNALTPFLRRCSTAPELIDSPGFSPILSGNSPHAHVSTAATPTSHLLQGTPGSGQVMHPLNSPGMSPIVQQDDSFTLGPTHKLRISKLRPCAEKIQIPVELRPSMENTKA